MKAGHHQSSPLFFLLLPVLGAASSPHRRSTSLEGPRWPRWPPSAGGSGPAFQPCPRALPPPLGGPVPVQGQAGSHAPSEETPSWTLLAPRSGTRPFPVSALLDETLGKICRKVTELTDVLCSREGEEGERILMREPTYFRAPLRPRPVSQPLAPPVGPDRPDKVREARLVFRGHRALHAQLNHGCRPRGWGTAAPAAAPAAPWDVVMCGRAAAGAAGKVKLSYRSF